jgi:hypothetical protein
MPFAASFKNSAQPRLLVHQHKDGAVDEQIIRTGARRAGFSTVVSLRLSTASPAICQFGSGQKLPALGIRLKRSAYLLKTSGVSNSGSVVSETSWPAVLRQRGLHRAICRVIRGHGPGQRVKMMSASQTCPRRSASVTGWFPTDWSARNQRPY